MDDRDRIIHNVKSWEELLTRSDPLLAMPEGINANRPMDLLIGRVVLEAVLEDNIEALRTNPVDTTEDDKAETRSMIARLERLLAWLRAQQRINILLAAYPVSEYLDSIPADKSQPSTGSSSVLPQEAQLDILLGNLNVLRTKVETKLRTLLKIGLQLNRGGWTDLVRDVLEDNRRRAVAHYSGDELMEHLYWLDLKKLAIAHWDLWKKKFGAEPDQFVQAMDIVNDRPDAHAKTIDHADYALYRRELRWLDDRLSA